MASAPQRSYVFAIVTGGEIPAYYARGGRGLFYLSDNIQTSFICFRHGLIKITALAEKHKLLFKLFERLLPFLFFDLFPFIRDDLFQYGHKCPFALFIR